MPVFARENRAAPPAPAAAAGARGAENIAPARARTGFADILRTVIDIVNPLQHLPVVGTVYRHLTGDAIAPVARIAGGALFGGPLGAGLGAASAVMEAGTGRDLGQAVLALARGAGAQNAAPPAAPPAAYSVRDIAWSNAAGRDKDLPQQVPREMMAARMQEALDKYAAMKRARHAPSAPARVF